MARGRLRQVVARQIPWALRRDLRDVLGSIQTGSIYQQAVISVGGSYTENSPISRPLSFLRGIDQTDHTNTSEISEARDSMRNGMPFMTFSRSFAGTPAQSAKDKETQPSWREAVAKASPFVARQI